MKEHLDGRYFDPDLYNCSWDEEVMSVICFNLAGQLCGFQNYRRGAPKQQSNDPKESRYFTYRPKHTLVSFGLETLSYRDDVVFLTEGLFDACRLHNLGLPAIATLSNDPKMLSSWLRTLLQTKVAVCDGDKAGKKLAKLGDYVITMPEETDLGDMTDDEVRETVSAWL